MVADIDPDPVLSATKVPSTVRCTPTLGQFPKCRCTEWAELDSSWLEYAPGALDVPALGAPAQL